MTRKVKFFVGLSDGSNVYEGKGEYDIDKAWLKLQEHLETNVLKITSLGLYTDFGQTWNLPSNTRLPIIKLNNYIQKKKVHIKVAYLVDKNKKQTRIAIPENTDLQIFLKDKITDNVTGIIFYTDRGKGLYFPKISTNPKVREFFDLEVENFNFFRIRAEDRDISGKPVGVIDEFVVVEAIMGNKKLQIWVNENNPRNSWSLIKNI